MRRLLTRLATRLRYKMLAGAVAVSAVIGAIGLIGFHYLHAVRASVSVTTGVTSPLLASALRASEATRRLVLRTKNFSSACAFETESADAASPPPWREDVALIDALRQTAETAGLRDQATQLSAARFKLGKSLALAGVLCGRRQDDLNRLTQTTDAMLIEINRLIADLRRLTLAFDRKMMLNEQRAKTALQAGGMSKADVESILSNSLIETWPVLQSLYTMREMASGLMDAVVGVAKSYDADDSGFHAVSRAKALSTVVRQHVAPRLRANGFERQADRLTGRLERITGFMLGDAGTEETVDRLRALDSEADRNESELAASESQLVTAVRQLMRQAQALDAAAQTRMTETIGEATIVIALFGGASVIALLLGSFAFIDRLTKPIEALTRLTQRLQAKQDYDCSLPRSLLTRPDEIGALAKSFNAMIASLGEARRRLLAESRAETRIQFQRLKTAIEGMPHGVYLAGADGRLLLSNARFAELYGLRRDQIADGAHSVDIAAACAANGAAAETETVEAAPPQGANGSSARQVVRQLQDGRTMVVTEAPTPDGGAVVIHEDITARKRAETQLAHLASHDALTDLPNRAQFHEHVAKALARLRAGQRLALLYLDLDHFKSVNDTLGYAIGDRLLVLASERLRACLGENDHVARVGGDEFAVILGSDPTPYRASAIAERVIEALSEPCDMDGHRVVVSASIGVAMAPADGDDADQLMMRADMALDRAKMEGRNTHRYFEAAMDEQMHERRLLELDLRAALDDDALELHYQPLMNAVTGSLDGFEALVRWRHPERGLISPMVFIPIAEETGQIQRIGGWILRQACCDAAGWAQEARVAVNISPMQFKTRTLAADVAAALVESGLQPDRLELEITEGVLLHDTDATLATLNELRDMGVRIAMDDFGTGYSSLSYLRKFTFDKVKIDQSFIRDLDQTAESRAIIRAVTGLCSSLGISTTAEGVETEEQLHALRQEGCTQVQGYYLGRPGPIASVTDYFDTATDPAAKRA